MEDFLNVNYLSFTIKQFESSEINQLTEEDHIEGATKFQHYIENSDHEQDDDFVLQDKLSDWRQWMMQNQAPIPEEFQDGFVAPAPVTLSLGLIITTDGKNCYFLFKT